jgi:lysophospholipid acyltransferase (LPLAT)-like uncharacterized protein
MFKDKWERFKRDGLPYPFVYLGKGLLRLLLWTCRIEIKGLTAFLQHAQNHKTILLLWHNRLLVLPELLQRYGSQCNYCAFISNSRDGELIAILTKSYPIGRVLRVPHDGRHQALATLIRQLREAQEVMVITPDGPRGPLYQVKAGVVLAAQATGASVVPFSWQADRYWQFNTWDKLRVPKPFARLAVHFGEPLLCERSSEADVETVRLQLALDAL